MTIMGHEQGRHRGPESTSERALAKSPPRPCPDRPRPRNSHRSDRALLRPEAPRDPASNEKTARSPVASGAVQTYGQPCSAPPGPRVPVSIYLDSSALLRLILREPAPIEGLQSEALVSSEILAVECPRTIDRLRLSGSLTLSE